MRCVPLTTTIGAEVHDVDLAGLGPEGFAELEAALLRHKVLMVRGQQLDDRAQRDLAARFGPIRRFPFGSPVDEAVPEVHAIATGGPGPKVGNADIWHSDATFQPAPPLGSVLRAVELPPTGGDTLFADTEAAFAALSPAVQTMLLGLTATHDVAKSSAHRTPREDFPAVHHPVVRSHPVTGRPSLFVNRTFTVRIDGLTERENEVLLPMLCDHVRSPDFQARLRWEPGSVAIWDNRCTQHDAVADYTERRVMYRVVIDGTAPVPASA